MGPPPGGVLNVNYTYDDPLVTFAKGRLTKAAYGNSGNTQFQYDELGREKTSVKSIDAVNFPVDRAYDALSRLTSIKYPDGQRVFYTYNAAGQIETVSGGATDYTQDPTCVGGWKLEETTGQYVDVCHVNPGTVIGTLTRGVSGQFGKAVEFLGYPSGNNAYVDFGSDSSLDNLGPRTIVAWIKPHNLGEASQGVILNKNYQDGWVFRLVGSNKLAFSQAFSGGVATWVTTASVLTMNSFQHVAVTYNGANNSVPTIYVNGVAKAVSGNTPFGTKDNDSAYTMKLGILDTTQEFDGVIDEVAVFNRVLSQQEINEIKTFGLGGSQVSYVRNADYNAAGQITKIELGNGTTTTYTYDPKTLRLSRLRTVNSAGTALQDFTYTYDSVGNIISINDSVYTANQAFKYDSLNRLTQAVGSYGTKDYVYDKIGNILQKDGLTYTYGQNGAGKHAVTALSDGTTFTYDVNGNMMTRTKAGMMTEYKYDLENRLIEVKKGGSLVAQFEYDGDGGRTKKISYVTSSSSSLTGMTFKPFLTGSAVTTTATVASTTKFVGSLYEETDTGRRTDYIFLGDTRIASLTNGKAMYYHADHLGGANVLTDDLGAVKELTEYEPYGQYSRHEKFGTPEEVSWFYFTGKQLDDETGLYYFGARYYDPVLGRFLTPDTIVPYPGDPQSLNRYSYARNNPVNVVDPTGHKWKWGNFFKAIGIAIVGTVLTIASGGTLAPVIGTYWAGVATGALAGATIGGTFAAGTGGNIGMGLLTGAVGGGLFAGLTPAFTGMMNVLYTGTTQVSLIGNAATISNFVSSFLGGAISGAAVAGISGGDVGQSALLTFSYPKME